VEAPYSDSATRGNARPDSSPRTSMFCAVRILPRAPRLLKCSCTSAPETVNQRQIGARGLAMRGETIRRDRSQGRPAHRQHLAPGPPRETSAHATPCRKTPYARRKTRTPRPGGQGVHSEPCGAPDSRAPLEVVLDRRRSDAQSPCARVRPRRAVDITRSHAADTCSRMPSACATRRMVSSRGCDDGCSAL